MRKMTAAILVGGLGSRLRGLIGDDTQKVLYPVAGQPLIRYSVDLFDSKCVRRIILCLGYLASEVCSWGRKQILPFGVDYMKQERPGVVPVVRQAFALRNEPELIVCNGDEIRLGLSVEAAIDFHHAHDHLATMVATYASNLSRHRVLQLDSGARLTSSCLHPKELTTEPDRVGLINTGLLILRRGSLEVFEGDGWSGIIDPLSRIGEVAVHVQPEVRYFNVGTSEEYREASQALASLNTPP